MEEFVIPDDPTPVAEPTEEQVADEPAEPVILLENFANEVKGHALELVFAWVSEEVQLGHFCDTRSHFQARLVGFRDRPILS